MLIKNVNFPRAQYYATEHEKVSIDLHHTSSGRGSEGDIRWWAETPEHVATPYIIERDGTVVQLYDDHYWAHRLGIKNYIFDMHFVPKRRKNNLKQNTWLNQRSIGIELDSWGGLAFVDGKCLSWTGKPIPFKYVTKYDRPYRGYHYFEKYTEAQINALYELIQRLKDRHCLEDIKYWTGMFEMDRQALLGERNLFNHTSVRPDKSDCHPQEELVQMLKSL